MPVDIAASAAAFSAALDELDPPLLAGPDAPDGVRLRSDALPASVWGSNLRGILSPAEWDGLRIPVCTRAGNRCEVCGARPRTGRPDCHEQWIFTLEPVPDAPPVPVQRLVRLVALCKACHRVQHTGLAGLRGEMDKVRAHLARVNGWTSAQVAADLTRAQERYALLELVPWDLDLRVLEGRARIAGYPDLYLPAEARSYLGNAMRSRRP